MTPSFYKLIHQSAVDMMAAAQANDIESFNKLYESLKQICVENQQGKNNHPVQWETLADFTEDAVVAIDLYEKALAAAEKVKDREYIASIKYAMADRYCEIGNNELALSYAQQAKEIADKLDDTELQDEIRALLKTITES